MIVWQMHNGENGSYVVSKNGVIQGTYLTLEEAWRYINKHATDGDFICVTVAVYN